MLVHRRTCLSVVLGLVAGVLLLAVPPAGAADLTEDFDDVLALAGWQTINLSDPVGTSTWRQGSASAFPARTGAANSYIAADFRAGGDEGTISTWLIAPLQSNLSSTDVVTFWSRTIDAASGEVHPDRLEVRMSANGSCDPGATSDGIGDFTTLLWTINPELRRFGYPTAWTRYDLPVTGLGTTNSSGCLAFRYFVTNGGPNTFQGEYIGIDSVRFTDNQSVACTGAQASVETAKVYVTQARAAVSGARARLTSADDSAGKAKKKLAKAKKKLKEARTRAQHGDSVRKINKVRRKVRVARKVARSAAVRVRSAREDLTVAESGLAAAQVVLAATRTTTASTCP